MDVVPVSAVKSSRIIPHNHFSVAVTIKIADTESKVATAPLVLM